MNMNHVGISVANLDRSIEFYKKNLGMELVYISPFQGESFDRIMALDDARGKMCVLSRGNIQLELFEFAHPGPAPQDPRRGVNNHGITHFGIEVTDLDGIYKRLLDAGVRFHCPVLKFEGGMKAVYARDPDGNVFELVERTSQTPG